MSDTRPSQLDLLARRQFQNYDEMYKVVDFLNKTLKERDLIFGLTKDKEGTMTISIYQT
ncbi:MAG: YpmA family protein [Eubacteriales bacterium]|jgi:hypothetical protein|nr:YpmA family protein [Bacillota bacterium]MBV1728275.1 YpmA family protein [Desulforudis sp.]MDP3051839.1 YpmA family protein [Eubacteriales bacterium]MDQ7789034.1 YpmA family protein [Clostridia bacterium]MBU4533823.1 YpmA family protein [Bacillota bacterium]